MKSGGDCFCFLAKLRNYPSQERNCLVLIPGVEAVVVDTGEFCTGVLLSLEFFNFFGQMSGQNRFPGSWDAVNPQASGFLVKPGLPLLGA